MYEHSCRRVGAMGCGFTARATTEDELKAKVTEHAMKVHKVKTMTDTIANYVISAARQA